MFPCKISCFITVVCYLGNKSNTVAFVNWTTYWKFGLGHDHTIMTVEKKKAQDYKSLQRNIISSSELVDVG